MTQITMQIDVCHAALLAITLEHDAERCEVTANSFDKWLCAAWSWTRAAEFWTAYGTPTSAARAQRMAVACRTRGNACRAADPALKAEYGSVCCNRIIWGVDNK